MKTNKKIIIIGAGPGGLTAGLLLQKKGYQVEIYEKESIPGGRNGYIEMKGFKFDIGPTFLMMKFILDEVFDEIGYKTDEILKMTRLDPMYRLIFDNNHLDVSDNHEKMKSELKRVFPGNEKGFDEFFKKEGQRFEYLKPCLEKPYSSFFEFFKNPFVHAIPKFSLPKSLYKVLNKYYKTPEAVLSFTFQSKYLGMSPWQCPGAFGMIPFVEHKFGIYHVEGGLSKISEVMAEIFEKMGGKIHYNTPVKKILFKGKKSQGILIENEEKINADAVIVNSDFGYSVANLFPDDAPIHFTKQKTNKMKYSCSTYMMYLGLDKIYNELQHHTIVFAKDYEKNIANIFNGKISGNNTSFYIRNSSVNDSTVAPKNQSQLYILAPTANKKTGKNIDWQKEKINMRKYIINALKNRLDLKDIENHIVVEKILTPDDWVNDNVHYGATFNLAHNLGQMLWFRPHNKLRYTDNVYLVGGGTHPGSGLPTIYESARITSKIIQSEL